MKQIQFRKLYAHMMLLLDQSTSHRCSSSSLSESSEARECERAESIEATVRYSRPPWESIKNERHKYQECNYLPVCICLTAFSSSHSCVLGWLNISRLWSLCRLKKRSGNVKEVNLLQGVNWMHVCPVHLPAVRILYSFPQLFQTNNTNEPLKFKSCVTGL